MSILETEKVSCLNCKYYDGVLCELNYASKAILDEERTAANCKYYSKGKFVNSDKHLLVKLD